MLYILEEAKGAKSFLDVEGIALVGPGCSLLLHPELRHLGQKYLQVFMGIFCLLCATTILGARVWEGNTSGTGDRESSSWLISLGKPNGEKTEWLVYPRARAELQFHTRCFKAPREHGVCTQWRTA